MNAYSTDKHLLNYYIQNFRRLFAAKDGMIEPKITRLYERYYPHVDSWQRKDFFRQLMDDEKFIGDGGWALFTLRPDPYLYYYRHFNVLPLITNEVVKTEGDYITAINSDPGNSPADAIAYITDTAVFSSCYGSSIYYFDDTTDYAVAFRGLTEKPFLVLP